MCEANKNPMKWSASIRSHHSQLVFMWSCSLSLSLSRHWRLSSCDRRWQWRCRRQLARKENVAYVIPLHNFNGNIFTTTSSIQGRPCNIQKTCAACWRGGGGPWTEVHDKIVHFLELLLNQIGLLHAVQWIANSYLNVIVTAHSQQFRCVREIKVYPRIDIPPSFVNINLYEHRVDSTLGYLGTVLRPFRMSAITMRTRNVGMWLRLKLNIPSKSQSSFGI